MIDGGALCESIRRIEPYPAKGSVQRIAAGLIEADGPDVSVGTLCQVAAGDAVLPPVLCLVAAVSDRQVRMVPFAETGQIKLGDPVLALPGQSNFPVGNGCAGRAINALGQPIDGGVSPSIEQHAAKPLPVLDRVAPSEVFATGIRSIDGLLTIGRGQRMGIFAASGVGKTKLTGQILHNSKYDRAVVCLVGERGREVEQLWHNIAEAGVRTKCTLVAATSDESAPMRARAVDQALALAEFWRARGEHVLLLVDSITRLAMAYREIGLIAGEPPTARGYTPNVFRELPRIVERCGAARGSGTITALFTVLCETDEADDPLVETMKSLLDGHILLSRKLAQAGHFPAIDINRSISRLFDDLVDEPQIQAGRNVRAWLARYEESQILIESGLYKAGGDLQLDQAVTMRPRITDFLIQSAELAVDDLVTRSDLIALAATNA